MQDAADPDRPTPADPSTPPAAPTPPGPTVPPAMAPSPTAAPAPRELRRSRHRKLAGVCGGFAEYFDIDPVIVRLAFVGGAFMGLATVPVYIAAWIVMPDADAAGRSQPLPQPQHDERVAA